MKKERPFCPLNQLGLISHYGVFDEKRWEGDDSYYIQSLCTSDCAWYDKESKGCIVKFLIKRDE